MSDIRMSLSIFPHWFTLTFDSDARSVHVGRRRLSPECRRSIWISKMDFGGIFFLHAGTWGWLQMDRIRFISRCRTQRNHLIFNSNKNARMFLSYSFVAWQSSVHSREWWKCMFNFEWKTERVNNESKSSASSWFNCFSCEHTQNSLANHFEANVSGHECARGTLFVNSIIHLYPIMRTYFRLKCLPSFNFGESND